MPKQQLRSLTLADLRAKEDPIGLVNNTIEPDVKDTMRGDFFRNFKWSPAPIDLANVAWPYNDWDNLNERLPLAEVVKLYEVLSAYDGFPRPGTHYISGLKVHCASDVEGRLIMLYQPLFVTLNGELMLDGRYHITEYNVTDEHVLDFYYFVGNALVKCGDAHPDQPAHDPESCIQRYKDIMLSRKYKHHDTWGTFIDIGDDKFRGDTTSGIIPFQEILTATGDYLAGGDMRYALFSHAASTYKLAGGLPGLTIRWKHHFIVEGNENIINPAPGLDNYNLCPPNCRIVTYIIQ